MVTLEVSTLNNFLFEKLFFENEKALKFNRKNISIEIKMVICRSKMYEI